MKAHRYSYDAAADLAQSLSPEQRELLVETIERLAYEMIMDGAGYGAQLLAEENARRVREAPPQIQRT